MDKPNLHCAKAVAVSENYAFVAGRCHNVEGDDDHGFISVIDVSDKASPVFLARAEGDFKMRSATTLAASGSRAFLADEGDNTWHHTPPALWVATLSGGGLQLKSTLASDIGLGSTSLALNEDKVVVVGDRWQDGDSKDDVQVVDVSNIIDGPSLIGKMHTLDVSGACTRNRQCVKAPQAVTIHGSYAFIAGYYRRDLRFSTDCHPTAFLDVVDVSDGMHPSLVGALTLPEFYVPHAVAVSGKYVAITAWGQFCEKNQGEVSPPILAVVEILS